MFAKIPLGGGGGGTKPVSAHRLCVFLWPIIKSKGHYCAENYWTRPKFKLNLRILVTHLYTGFQFKMSICNGDNEQKLKSNGIFLSKGHNSAKNYSTRPKFQLNLPILMTNLRTKFHFKMSICKGDNEWKLKINGIFLSPRGITLPKIIRLDPNSNSTCVFSWQTYIQSFIWISPCMTEIMSGNWIRNDGKG